MLTKSFFLKSFKRPLIHLKSIKLIIKYFSRKKSYFSASCSYHELLLCKWRDNTLSDAAIIWVYNYLHFTSHSIIDKNLIPNAFLNPFTFLCNIYLYCILYKKITRVKILFCLFLLINKLKISSTIYKTGVEFLQLLIGIINFLITFITFIKNTRNEKKNIN